MIVLAAAAALVSPPHDAALNAARTLYYAILSMGAQPAEIAANRVVKTRVGWDAYLTLRINGAGPAFLVKVCEDRDGRPFTRGWITNISAGGVSCDGMAHT